MGTRLLLAGSMLLLFPAPALAWGPEGHEVIAHIAARELTPRARAQLSALLGGDAEAMMVADANWADEIRDARPDTARWHFVDIPLASAGFVRARDCPDSNCVVGQIEMDARAAADPGRSRAVRAEALKFLIHFVGDVHQPLHAIDNHDHGGNDIKLRLGRYRTSLHHFWDTVLVEAMGDDAAAVAAGIAAHVTPRDGTLWQSGTPVGWANESWAVAKRGIYDRQGDPRGLARIQLARAGVRLAWLLNAMFR